MLVYQCFGFVYTGRPLSQEDMLALYVRKCGQVVLRVIEMYTFVEGGKVTAAVHFSPPRSLSTMRAALSKLGCTVLVPMSKPHPCSDYEHTSFSVGVQRTKIRWGLFEARGRAGFQAYIVRTLPRDMFGVPNPACIRNENNEEATTEDLPGDNESDVTLDIDPEVEV